MFAFNVADIFFTYICYFLKIFFVLLLSKIKTDIFYLYLFDHGVEIGPLLDQIASARTGKDIINRIAVINTDGDLIII